MRLAADGDRGGRRRADMTVADDEPGSVDRVARQAMAKMSRAGKRYQRTEVRGGRAKVLGDSTDVTGMLRGRTLKGPIVFINRRRGSI